MMKKWMWLLISLPMVCLLCMVGCQTPPEGPSTVQTSASDAVATQPQTTPAQTNAVDLPATVPGTDATEPVQSETEEKEEPTTQPTSGTQEDVTPTETKPPEPSHTQTTVPILTPEQTPNTSMTYEQYNALSGDVQMEFMNSFPSIPDFVNWYNAAKAEHEKNQIEIGADGKVDLTGGGNG